MANKNFKVKNSITIPEPLALTEGGTGQTSATNALNALLPVQSSAASKFLQSDGTNVSWVANVAYQRGGTGSRPGSPTVGDLYYNTDYNYFESYTSNGWFPIAAAPGIPTGVAATNQGSGRAYNNGQMSVAFTAATSGGSPTSFIVTPSPSTSPSTFTGSSSPVTVTGLASSTQYTYTVSATSPYGTSSASSASSGVTATTVPQAPTINSVESVSADSASITFTAGATGGSAITQYTITSTPSTTTQTTSSSPYTFTGLTLGETYTFTMTATNANGTSTSTTSSSVLIEEPDSGSMFPIYSTTVGSTSVSEIVFSNIPSTYTHLQIRFNSVNSSGTGSTFMQLNGDTGSSNYSYQYLGRAGAATVVAGSSGNAPYIFMGNSSQTPGYFLNHIIDILEYKSTNKIKSVKVLSGINPGNTGNAAWVGIESGALQTNTNAITSIRLYSTSGNFTQNTRATLYGIK